MPFQSVRYAFLPGCCQKRPVNAEKAQDMPYRYAGKREVSRWAVLLFAHRAASGSPGTRPFLRIRVLTGGTETLSFQRPLPVLRVRLLNDDPAAVFITA